MRDATLLPATASNEGIAPADPCLIVIFGAAGDLTQRKVLPALFDLSRRGLLSPNSAVLGLSVETFSHEDFRGRMRAAIAAAQPAEAASAAWKAFESRLYYTAGDFRDPAAYARLAGLLAEASRQHSAGGNCLFYLATPPSFFGEIVRQLAAAGLTREDAGADVSPSSAGPNTAEPNSAPQLAPGWRRVVIEKPFGHDWASAQALNAEVLGVLGEQQVFRIDHYLGKETVQNILVFRFANGIHEPVWNRRYIDHVQITAAETLGVEHRGGYYEHAGALRDMIPSHLFQLLAMTAMEAPTSFAAEAVRDEKTKVLHAIRPLTPEEVLGATVRGQYGAGRIAEQSLPGYRQAPQVSVTSNTETYVALRLTIDSWRWAGVPFYLRTGKALTGHATEIVIQFKQAPLALFRETAVTQLGANQLVLHIQPDEGISLRFIAKVPGIRVRTSDVKMNFAYQDYFAETPFTGYATLLYDALQGDATLFQRADFVAAGWSVVQPILDVWQSQPPRDFPNYAAGSWGPTAADELLARDGRCWRSPQS